MEHSYAGNAGNGKDNFGQRPEDATTGERRTMDIPDSGKLAGIADIQRLAALANAKSQQTVRPANTDVLENRRAGEEADTSTADRKKVAESKKDRHIGDDLER